ncbi:MAG: hypothetical protein ACYSXF_10430 [Planctomycetota bacterium]
MAALLGGLIVASPAAAVLRETAAGFDQIARIQALGGSTRQVGGDDSGRVLSTASGFSGSPDERSGVSVRFPNYVFVAGISVLNDGGVSKTGNTAAQLRGAPTALTFTTPGSGGPDRGPGDGSVTITAGGFATLDFGAPLTAPEDEINDLFFFTNTTGGGTVTIDLLGPDLAGVVGTLVSLLPGGPVGSGRGGLILDVPAGLVYRGLRLAVTAFSVEIDAIAAARARSVCGDRSVDV